MKYLFDICVYNWNQYWGDGLILILLAGAAAFVLIRERRNRAAMLLLGCLLISAGLFFFPVSAGVIRRVIGRGVYWRVLWLIPMIPLIAFGLSSLVVSAKWKALRIILAGLAAAAVIVTGSNVFSVENYQQFSNPEQVPDEVAEIGRKLQEHADGREILVAADDYVATYLRVYDPSIKMIYGRDYQGAASRKDKLIYRYINVWPDTDYVRLCKLAVYNRLDYIVMKKPSEEGKRILAKGRFRIVSRVRNYVILENRRKIQERQV